MGSSPKSRFNWRHQYDDERDKLEQQASDFTPIGESLTIQAAAIDQDINEIVRRYGIGEGTFPPPLDPSAWADVTNMPDLRDILEIQREAADYFRALPARIRNRFRNDPLELLTFVQDPENLEEGIALGIFEKKAPAEPAEAMTLKVTPEPSPNPPTPTGEQTPS